MRMKILAATAAASLAVFVTTLHPAAEAATSQFGVASYYKSGKRTANGERFNPMGLTAAHRKLPFGTRVRITHIKSGRSVVVRINDRGPFIGGRIIDLSLGAAQVIGLNHSGVAKVAVEVLGSPPAQSERPAPPASRALAPTPARRTLTALNPEGRR